MKKKSLSKEAMTFWKGIVYKNGKLNEGRVLKELTDYYVVLNEVPKVYNHITGGKLSKPLYCAEVVIAEADDYISENFVYKDVLKELLK